MRAVSDSGDIKYLNPNSLNYFFSEDQVFAFQNELDSPHIFSFAQCFPTLRKEDQPALHLLESEGGGVTQFVNEFSPFDKQKLKEKISTLFGLDIHKIELKEIERSQNFFFQFRKEIDPKQNVVPFEYPNRMPVTHQESQEIIQAFDDTEKKVYMISWNTFWVNCKVEASLVVDTPLLKAALEAEVTNKEECLLFLGEEIGEKRLIIDLNTLNQPSQETINKVQENLLDPAADKILNVIRDVRKPSQLPDPYTFKLEFKESIPQPYLLEVNRDLGKQFTGIPLEKLVSHSNTPLPEPAREDDPIPPDPDPLPAIKIALNFDPQQLGILKIEVEWGTQKEKMKWPNFPPLIIQRSDDNDSETLKVTTQYSDYQVYTVEFQVKENIKLNLNHIGITEVLFDGTEVEEFFERVQGSAEYHPNDRNQRSVNASFTFPGPEWTFQWTIRSLAPGLAGTIIYDWTGKYSNRWKKDYQSGTIETTDSNIQLEKK